MLISSMPDLQLAPARGRTSLAAISIALLVLVVTALGVFYLNPRRTAELAIKDVKTFAPHTTFKELPAGGKGVHVLGDAAAAEDNLYVIATLDLTDKLRLPLFLNSWSATVTLADGSTQEGTPVHARDLERLTDVFPSLAPMVRIPLHDGDEVQPSRTRQGSVVVLFPGLTQEAWRTKKLARLTLALRNQEAQIVTLP